MSQPSHYYDRQPTVESKPTMFTGSWEGRSFQFKTDRGVFSKGSLDIGTSVLLEAIIRDIHDNPIMGHFLDLGCGYGVVGIVLKRLFKGIDMTFSDVNERALELTRQNIQLNQLHQGTVVSSDGFENLDGLFDVIITNPPIRAGKQTVYRFFDDAQSHLTPTGRLYVVIGKKQGAPSAERHLSEVYERCQRIHRDKGFVVFRCE